MAAVVKWSNWCKLLPALLFIISLSFSSISIQDDPSLGLTTLDVTGEEGVISAKLTYTQVTSELGYDPETLAAAFAEYQKGNISGAEEILGAGGVVEHFESISSSTGVLEGVPVDFYYYSQSLDSSNQQVYTRVDIACEDPALQYTDPEGIARCGLPESAYQQKCIEVFASFGDPVYGYQSESGEKYLFSQDSLRVCDSETSAISVMSIALQTKLQDSSNQPLCLVSILMGGLLIASMFFAGRSPLSLLDLTTPLLPKAKSISYGGIMMGTGLTRISKQMAEMGAEGKRISAASKETTELLLRHLRSQKGGYNKALLDRIMGSKADAALKMMAVHALIAGKGRAFIDRILALSGKQVKDESYQEEYGKLLSELKRSDSAKELNGKVNLHDAVILISEMNIFNQMQAYVFGQATGGVPPKLKKALQSTLGRLPLIGTHVMGAAASVFAAGRMTGRMYTGAAGSTIRAVGNLAEGEGKYSERIQMSIDARKKKGLKPTLWQKLVSPYPEDQTLSYLFNTYDYGSALYKRLMAEAKKDVVNWLLGTAIAHYGGKVNLTMEEVLEIGKKTPEEMMFSKFRKGDFAKFEKEVREALSASAEVTPQLLNQVMQIMRTHGIRFDQAGAEAAIMRLQQIETGAPQGFSEGEYDSREAIINCYRLNALQGYLREQFKVDQPIDLEREYDGGKKFFFTAGRTTLSGPTSDYTFRTFFLSRYQDSLSSKTHSGMKPTSISDIANFAFLRVVNERWGIIDPSTPGLKAEIKLVMENAKLWLQSLANPEKFKEMGLDIRNMQHLLNSLSSPGARAKGDPLGMMDFGHEYGPLSGVWRTDMKAHWRTVGGFMGGAKTSVEEQAYGEVAYAHTVPLAVQKIMDQARLAGKKISQDEAERKYLQDILVPSHLMNRLKGIIEQPNPNAYFTSQSEYDRFRQLWAAYKAHIARDKGLPDERSVTDKQVEEFIKKPLGLQDMAKYTWWGMREGTVAPMVDGYSTNLAQADRPINAKYYLRRGGQWEVFKPDKFAPGTIKELLGRDSKLGKMLFGEMDYSLREGEIRGIGKEYLKQYVSVADKLKLAGVKGLSAAQAARYQADVKNLMGSLADLATGSPKKAEACAALVAKLYEQNRGVLATLGYSASKIYESGGLKDTRLGEKVRMLLLAKDYEAADTPQNRETAAKALKEWAVLGPDREERHVKVALLFYQNAEKTGNWADFNGYKEAVRIAPPMGNMPQYDKFQPVSNDAVGGARGLIKKVFNTFSHAIDPTLKAANMGLESFVINSFAKTARFQYEGSLVSEYFRETGAKFAAKFAAGEFGNPDDRASPAMREYNRLVDTFTRYHALWDETITRDPRGNSSAIGSAFIFSSFFHHGPAMAFGPGPYTRWSHAGYKTPWTTPSGFAANVKERLWGLQWAPQIFNWAVGSPFGISYRTYITSRWGYMSKHDRRYAEPPAYSQIASKEYREEAVKQYQKQMDLYNSQVDLRKSQLQLDSSLDQATADARARQEFAPLKPESPAFGLERDILHPFHQTMPRTGEATASLTNWFYSAFDPSSTNWKRGLAIAASAPLLPFTMFPSRWIQSKILKNGTPLMNRDDKNPYYISPGGLRAAMISAAGPMVKRKYGGTEMQTGVVRSHEDTWSYQAGVNAIWGNTNPGASYVDFSGSLHMDARAANYLRYESRFRPFFQQDEYIEKQANLGIVRREINPYKMIMERTNELSGYEFPSNSLFRFLSPATWAAYTGSAMLGKVGRAALFTRDVFRGPATHTSVTRGGKMATMAGSVGQAVENYVSNKRLSFMKGIKYCQICRSPMAEGGTCPVCSRKERCSFCGQVVNASGFHTCTHGLRRNLIKDDLYSP